MEKDLHLAHFKSLKHEYSETTTKQKPKTGQKTLSASLNFNRCLKITENQC